MSMDRPITKSLECELCSKEFYNSYNLKRHHINVHKITYPGSQSRSLRCGICSSSFKTFISFCKHLTSHGIKIETEEWKFKTESEFHKWRISVQERDCVSFVKRSVLPNWEGHVTFFRCSRSGDYKSRVTCPNERKREIKCQGSQKINAFCPSRIRCTVKKDGSVCVSYCKTHVGHELDLSHINLRTHERQELAAKLASNLPPDAVLEEAKNSLINTQSLKRKHLLKKADLRNIINEFGLDEDVTHPDKTSFVDEWVKRELLFDKNCIILYKQKGNISEQYPLLDKNDFALGIMTEAQIDMLKKYWSNCIFIDSAHGKNPYNYEMTSVLVLDDFRQAFPCAFFFSNKHRSNKLPLKTFFNCLKNIIGSIQPKLVMTDVDEELYSAWFEVMGNSFIHLFCKCHVERAWQKNLKKIRDCNLRNEAYNKLKTIQRETDEQAFEKMLLLFVESLCDNQGTEKFCNYFKNKFVQSVSSWAFCYRKSTRTNVDISLDKMHNEIKFLFLKGKSVKRLDKTIHAILQLVNKKHINHLAIEKGGETVLLRRVQSRHRKSLSLSGESVMKHSERSWDVSSTQKEVYRVTLVKNNCDCSVVCTDCKSCIHKFHCTCIDASRKWNMCEHIHLVVCTRPGDFLPDVDQSDNQTNIEIDQVFSLNTIKIISVDDVNSPLKPTADENPQSSKKQKMDIKAINKKAIKEFNSLIHCSKFVSNQVRNMLPKLSTGKSLSL